MYPILVEFGPITVHTLWFFISLGFVIWSLIVAKLAKRNRLRLDFLLRHSFFLVFWTIIASRLLFTIFHFSFFPSPVSFFKIWDKGLSFWGAVAGFLLAFLYLARKEKEPIRRWFDIFAMAFPVGMILGSIGAFLDGMAHGHETNLPWGIIFQSASVKYAVPIHPTQLYALIYLIGIAIFLFVKEKTWRQRPEGFIFEMTIFLLSGFRFLEEFFRGDDVFLIFEFLRFPQLTTFVLLLFFLWRHRSMLGVKKF